MVALASIDYYEAITGSLETPDPARLRILLELAEGAVLAGAHGQNIVEQEYEDATLYNSDGRFYFPQRPVTDVASVVVDGVTLAAGTDYRFTSGGDGRAAALIRRVNGRDSWWACAEATVTYTAGWATVPAQIIGAVVATAHGIYNGSDATTQTITPEGQAIPSFPAVVLAPLAMKLQPAVQQVIDGMCKVKGPASVEIVSG